MQTLFTVMLAFVLTQRGIEISLAKRNEKWIRSRGGIEAGADHYKYIVGLHVLFFLTLIGEFSLPGVEPPKWWSVPFCAFLVAQGLRYWCIRSLGPFWNTRILVLPGASPVCRGPYRYLRHPNYLVVTLELFTLPLLFGCYLTALVFPLLNLFVLRTFRIPAEEKALREAQAQSGRPHPER
ncbi:alkylpyrone methyltransferase [Bacillaceae bacterium]